MKLEQDEVELTDGVRHGVTPGGSAEKGHRNGDACIAAAMRARQP
jgi:chorismate synthase